MKNAITWFDIPTLDFNRAVKFYSEILGEEVRVNEFMGKTIGFFPMEGDMKVGVGGDLVLPDPSFVPSSDGSRVYLNCDGKLDEVLSRVVGAGGTIINPKFSLGDPGFIAHIKDTEGNLVGLHSFS